MNTQTDYRQDIEIQMKRLFATLSKMDRRRYAAVEAAKFGSRGISAIFGLLGLDAKTVRCELTELALLKNSAQGRVRKEAVDASC
jgi:hypothetical protein